MKTYDSVLVAKYLLSIANSKKINLNVTKVQKLMYIAYGYFLAENQNHRIIDESPRAWPYGPVFPKTQNKVDYTNILDINATEFEEIKKDIDLTIVLNNIVDGYSKYTASQLSEWSHQKDGPWYKTTKLQDFKWNTIIPDQFIAEYFKTIDVL